MEQYEEHLRNNELLPRTIEAYCYDVSRFLRLFPEPINLTPKDISDHVKRMSGGPKRKKRYLSAVSSYYTFLMEEGMTDFNPVGGVRRPRSKMSLPRYLTKREIDTVRLSCETLTSRTIVDTLYFTGIRLDELRTCQLTSLDLEKRELRVLGKGHKPRFVPFPVSLIPLYEEYLLHREELPRTEDGRNVLFLNHAGKQFTQSQIQHLMRKISKQSGIKVRCHVLRHTFATHALERGMSRQAVQKIMGHASVSTTDWYIHLEPDVRSDYERAFS